MQKVVRIQLQANVSGSGDQLGSTSKFGDADALPGPVLGSGKGCTAVAFHPSASVGYSASTVTITGANDPITFTPSGSSPSVVYHTNYGGSTTPEFDSGATLMFSAPGGPDIGAFSGSVTGPAPIAGFTPPTSISRGSALSLTWTAATSSNMQLILLASDPSTHANEAVRCEFSDTGSFTIPSAVLSLLGSTYTTGTFYFTRVNETSVSAGGWTIYLDAIQGDERATGIPIGP